MLRFFNSSIFNKSLPHDHDCTKDKCSGSELFGLNRTCRLCLNVSFFECISKRPGIKSILNHIVPVDFDGQSQTQLAAITRELSVLFGQESVFQFICPSCLLSEGLNNVNLPHDDVLNKQRKQITTLKSSNTKLNKEIERLKLELSNLPQTSDNSGQHTQIESIGDLQNRVKSLELIISDSHDMIKSQTNTNKSILNWVEQCKSEINLNNIALESMQNSIKDIISTTSNTDNIVNSNDRQTDVLSQSVHDMASLRLPEEKTKPINSNPSIPNYDPSTSSKTIPTLKVPLRGIINDTSAKGNGDVYEIFVTKFHPTTTCSDIEQFIIGKTSIAAQKFAVKKLIRSKVNIEKLTFVSFKIITLDRTVFNTILDDKVWAPNFNASVFTSKSSDKKKNNVHWNDNNKTPLITTTPNKLTQRAIKNGFRRKLTLTTPKKTHNTPKPTPKSRHGISNNQFTQQQQQQQQPIQLIPIMIPPNMHMPSQHQNSNFWATHNGLQQPHQAQWMYPPALQYNQVNRAPMHQQPQQH